GVVASVGTVGGGVDIGCGVHGPDLNRQFVCIFVERGHVGGARAFGQPVAARIGTPQRGGGGHIGGEPEEGGQVPAGGAEAVRQQSAADVAEVDEQEPEEQGGQTGAGEAETGALLGPDLEYRARRLWGGAQAVRGLSGDPHPGPWGEDDAAAEVAQSPTVFDAAIGGPEHAGGGTDPFEFAGGHEQTGQVEAERLRATVALALIDL